MRRRATSAAGPTAPAAGVGGEGLPEVEVLLVNLVGIVRFETDQTVVGKAGGDVEPLLDRQIRPLRGGQPERCLEVVVNPGNRRQRGTVGV